MTTEGAGESRSTNWKPLIGFLILLLALSLGLGLLMVVKRPDTMTFLFTGDTQGYLVPCGCSVVPAGGLARRESILKGLEKNRSNGEVVPVEVTHGFADRGPGKKLLNEEMGRFFDRWRCRVGIGSYDLLLGLKALHGYTPGGAKLFLAGNPSLPGSEEFHLGGWGVGPIGEYGARLRLVFLEKTAPGGVKLGDVLKVFKAEAGAHPAEGYIVTGQFPPATAGKLLKANPDIIAIVAQWQSIVTTIPQKAVGAWVLYIGDRGRRASVVKVSRLGKHWSLLPAIAYLGPSTPSDAGIAKEVKAVLGRVEAVNRKALASLKKPLLKGERGYVGAKRCGGCHASAYVLWKKSSHARAVADLDIDHQRDNPACLRCHATALGKPGGYPRGTVKLSGVQCEACHGPGAGHPPAKLAAVPPDLKHCASCHDKRDSPTFNAEGYWTLIKH